TSSPPLTTAQIPPRMDLSGQYGRNSENAIASTRAWTMPRNPGPQKRPYSLCPRHQTPYRLGARSRGGGRQRNCRRPSKRGYKDSGRKSPVQLCLIQLHPTASQSCCLREMGRTVGTKKIWKEVQGPSQAQARTCPQEPAKTRHSPDNTSKNWAWVLQRLPSENTHLKR